MGVVLYAAVASLTRPQTGAAALAVAVPVVAGLVMTGINRRSPEPAAEPAGEPGAPAPGARRTTALWALVVGLAIAWELAAWLQQPAYNIASHEHPTVSILLDPVTEAGIPRFAAWCCWLYVGYRVVCR